MDDVTSFESSFEAMPGSGTRRMDVLPAGPARRHWPEETRARIVAESMEPGANVSDVARRNDILPQQLYAWRRAAKERMEAGRGAAFVPAVVEKPDPPSCATSADFAEIRIELSGVVIRVPDGASADHIERVLLAVQVAT